MEYCNCNLKCAFLMLTDEDIINVISYHSKCPAIVCLPILQLGYILWLISLTFIVWSQIYCACSLTFSLVVPRYGHSLSGFGTCRHFSVSEFQAYKLQARHVSSQLHLNHQLCRIFCLHATRVSWPWPLTFSLNVVTSETDVRDNLSPNYSSYLSLLSKATRPDRTDGHVSNTMNSCYLSTSFWPVYSSDPVIGKPVCKNTRVIEAKNINVCSMDKVMRQNHNVAFSEPRANNADLWWIKAFQLINKLLCPSCRLHHSVVIHTVVVVHVVHVRCHHGIILRPRWASWMLTLNKMQADIHMKPVAFWTLQLPIHTVQQHEYFTASIQCNVTEGSKKLSYMLDLSSQLTSNI